MELSTVFLYIFCGTLAVMLLNLFFGHFIDHLFNVADGYFNTTSTLCFVGVTSAIGYFLSKHTSLSTFIILVIGILVSLILTVVLNTFVFVPLSKMESSTAFRIEDMRGLVGEVTLTIPANSIGEVMIKTPMGIVSRTAVSFNKVDIALWEKVLIVDVVDNIFHVEKYGEETLD
jgi:cytochrome c biogenesis factor